MHGNGQAQLSGEQVESPGSHVRKGTSTSPESENTQKEYCTKLSSGLFYWAKSAEWLWCASEDEFEGEVGDPQLGQGE